MIMYLTIDVNVEVVPCKGPVDDCVRLYFECMVVLSCFIDAKLVLFSFGV